MASILLVEDHLSIAQVIAEIFPSPRFEFSIVHTLEKAYQFLHRKKPSLIILDRGLPDGDGLNLLESLQLMKSDIPVLILSNKVLTQDKIISLRSGADDYLTKPFSIEELELRVHNLLKKTKHLVDTDVVIGELEIMSKTGQVKYKDKQVLLRKRECEILSFLAKHKNQVMSREQIINHIWNEDEIPTYKTIDVYVRRIRTLLGTREKVIQTVRGYGYMMKEKSPLDTQPVPSQAGN
jgi:DNA-binding response OmpR family regulator